MLSIGINLHHASRHSINNGVPQILVPACGESAVLECAIDRFLYGIAPPVIPQPGLLIRSH
jgi:hypothetical protein